MLIPSCPRPPPPKGSTAIRDVLLCVSFLVLSRHVEKHITTFSFPLGLMYGLSTTSWKPAEAARTFSLLRLGLLTLSTFNFPVI